MMYTPQTTFANNINPFGEYKPPRIRVPPKPQIRPYKIGRKNPHQVRHEEKVAAITAFFRRTRNQWAGIPDISHTLNWTACVTWGLCKKLIQKGTLESRAKDGCKRNKEYRLCQPKL